MVHLWMQYIIKMMEVTPSRDMTNKLSRIAGIDPDFAQKLVRRFPSSVANTHDELTPPTSYQAFAMSLQIFDIHAIVRKHKFKSDPACVNARQLDNRWREASQKKIVKDIKDLFDSFPHVPSTQCTRAITAGCCNSGLHGRARRSVVLELEHLPTTMVS